MMSARLYIVEDQAVTALDLRLRLVGAGYAVVGMAADAQTAIEAINKLRPDLVLMDIRLKGSTDGIQAAEEIWARHHVPIVFVTAHSDSDTIKRAASTHLAAFILKPYDEQELLLAIELGLERRGVGSSSPTAAR